MDHAQDYTRHAAGPDVQDDTPDEQTSVNDFMETAIALIAARAKVRPTSVSIAYAPGCDGDPEPWCVKIALAKGKTPQTAAGYGSTVDQAASRAVASLPQWAAVGFQRAQPVG